ncbi:uncharacterized protein KQ657_001830 [Scheffersomyces spartinae]|uniref:Protein transport protein SEC23 n=1 Tax=Scheffersomyces spartinae TaxID=45513 RepID=A0A9P7V6S5_9ASCO|nr:uncharacterized protein KQ657_001830 [Scheffersomyces spartinae]KAG7192429.1 hypothetical protein KQ657_001830 [Scheffersomyces spartinae]
MDFEEREDKDGIRLSWSCLPKSRLQHHRNVVPFGALYTPLNTKTELPVLPKESLETCRQCRSSNNQFTQGTPEMWSCHFCGFNNRRVTTEPIPLSTVEYCTGQYGPQPIFFYVVDTCFENEDVVDAFVSLKELLAISLSLLPENALVGLITYGKHVHLHDLNSGNSLKLYSFNGSKEYTKEKVELSIGLLPSSVKQPQSSMSSVAQRFLQPVSIAEFQFESILDSLTPNVFPHSAIKERPLRLTGCALNVTLLLLSSLLNGQTSGGHVLCFIGGVCTYGPGSIVSLLLKEPLRSHHDIEKSRQATLPNTTQNVNVLLIKLAKKFYHAVAQNFVLIGLSCDIFIGCYDQVGLWEMDDIPNKTGGAIVLCDSFSTSIFKQSLQKFFRKHYESDFLEMGFNGTLEIKVQADLKIQGLLGHATSLKTKLSNKGNTPNNVSSSSISHTVVGEGDTNAWKLCSVDNQSTYAIYFEKGDSVNKDFTFIQFLFHYQHPSGEMRLRVTTLPVAIVADSDAQALELGFDQDAATVLMARVAIQKLKSGTSSPKEIQRLLDNQLVEYCSRFAVYNKGQLETFRLLSQYSIIPQSFFYLRRSPFIDVFGASPDETAFTRHTFFHEDVNNSLIMIQPSLILFDIDKFGEEIDGEPNYTGTPVLLDSCSLGPDKILLLDTFFHILIFHGSTVASWRQAKYHELEGYEHFKAFLEEPRREAMELLMERFPLPRFIDTNEGGSQARFLMAKLNPSTTYNNPNTQLYGSGQLDVLTDDISLQLYMELIKKSTVNKK